MQPGYPSLQRQCQARAAEFLYLNHAMRKQHGKGILRSMPCKFQVHEKKWRYYMIMELMASSMAIKS
jgi:hypothetical protein